MKEINYSKMNPNDFTQKDLMLHLLQVTQHTVTREELKEDISKVELQVQKLDTKIDKVEENLNNKIDKVEENLNNKIDKVEENLNNKIDKVEENLNIKIDKLEENLNIKMDKLDSKISKIDAKFDKVQWLIIATILTVLLKDKISLLLS